MVDAGTSQIDLAKAMVKKLKKADIAELRFCGKPAAALDLMLTCVQQIFHGSDGDWKTDMASASWIQDLAEFTAKAETEPLELERFASFKSAVENGELSLEKLQCMSSVSA